MTVGPLHLEPAGEADLLLGDEWLTDLKLDLSMCVQRDVARVALIHLAVVDRHDMALDRPERRWSERLAPLVEEVAKRVGAVDRRLDVNDAVRRMGVQPVQAGSALGDRALRRLHCPRAGDSDASRELPLRPVDENRQMRMNVEDRLLRCLAANAINLAAGRGRRLASQRRRSRDGNALEARRAGLRRGLQRAERAQRAELELRSAGGRRRLASAASHRERDGDGCDNGQDRRADPHEQATLPGLPRFPRPHLGDLRPGNITVPARLGHLFRSSLPGQAAVQPLALPAVDVIRAYWTPRARYPGPDRHD